MDQTPQALAAAALEEAARAASIQSEFAEDEVRHLITPEMTAALALAENIATLHERQDIGPEDSPDGPVAVIDWYVWEALVADARSIVKGGAP